MQCHSELHHAIRVCNNPKLTEKGDGERVWDLQGWKEESTGCISGKTI